MVTTVALEMDPRFVVPLAIFLLFVKRFPVKSTTDGRYTPAVPDAGRTVKFSSSGWSGPVIVVESKVHSGGGTKHSLREGCIALPN